MPQRKRVFMLSNAPQMSSDVSAALQAGNQFELVGVCDDLAALKARLERGDVQAALVDVDQHPGQVLGGLGSATSRFPEVRFVILASEVQQEMLIEAMQVGARHVLQKPKIPGQLDTVLRRLVPDGALRVAGRIVTLLSVSGGCGATTLAMNLANEMQILSKEPALLVDLDLHYGAVALWLGLEGQFGMRDVLAFGDGIDSHLVRSTAQSFDDNLHVLLSPANSSSAPTSAGPVDFKHLEEALDACRYAYSTTVIDAPRLPLPVAAQLSMASAATLLVMQLTVRDIHMARSLLAELVAQGADTEQLRLVVNRHWKRSTITLDEARQALGGYPLTCISNDFRNVSKAMNQGQLLASAASSCSTRKDLIKLAQNLTGSNAKTKS